MPKEKKRLEEFLFVFLSTVKLFQNCLFQIIFIFKSVGLDYLKQYAYHHNGPKIVRLN